MTARDGQRRPPAKAILVLGKIFRHNQQLAVHVDKIVADLLGDRRRALTERPALSTE